MLSSGEMCLFQISRRFKRSQQLKALEATDGSLTRTQGTLHLDRAAGAWVITVRASCLHSQSMKNTGVSLGKRARNTALSPTRPLCFLVPGPASEPVGAPALLGTHHMTPFPPAQVHPAQSLAWLTSAGAVEPRGRSSLSNWPFPLPPKTADSLAHLSKCSRNTFPG